MPQHYTRIQRIPEQSLPDVLDLLLPASFIKKHGISCRHLLELVYGVQTTTVEFEIAAVASTIRIRGSLAQFLPIAEKR